MFVNYLLALLIFSPCITLANDPQPVDLSFHVHHELSPRELNAESARHDHQIQPIPRLNVTPRFITPTVTLKARPTTVYRPRSIQALHRARLRSLHHDETEDIEWDQLTVLGPDLENKHTINQLARMAGDAYALPGQGNWYEVDSVWSRVRSAIPNTSRPPTHRHPLNNRASHLAGRILQMVFVATYSYLQTTPQSYYQSREPRSKAQHPRKTSSTITCELYYMRIFHFTSPKPTGCSPAVAPASISPGSSAQSATATHTTGAATADASPKP